MQRGIATFTLDSGTCPKWLFDRMVALGRSMTEVIIAEEGPDAFVARIADPVWFQSLGTVLAFDWNASGLTTILTAALKEAIRGREKEWGVAIAGGKGKTSRKAPDQILYWGDQLELGINETKSLVYNSRMSAKVDANLIQDGFQIYHHAFFMSKNGAWTVVQQGMNTVKQTARRYHWHSNDVKDLIEEPHTAIQSEVKFNKVLNMTSHDSNKSRHISHELVVRSGYMQLMKDITLLRRHSTPQSKMASFALPDGQLTLLELTRNEFSTLPVIYESFSKSKYLEKILWKLTDEKPETYEQLLATEGVGPKTIRALALVSEVIYGAAPSYEDPARYSFAHGGKDEIPFPVDRATYDKTINLMKKYVTKSKIALSDKQKAQKSLDMKVHLNAI